MGPSGGMIYRVLWRVGASSSGEVVGRAVNILVPFALLAIHRAGASTDAFFLAAAVAFFVHGTLANVVVSALVPEFVHAGGGRRGIRQFACRAFLVGALAGIVTAVVVGPNPSYAGTAIAALAVTLMAATGLVAAAAAAMFYSQHRYFVPGVTWALRLVPLAVYVWWRPPADALYWLLAGFGLADLARTAILLACARSRLCLGRGWPPLRIPKSASPLMLGTLIIGLIPLWVRWVAGHGAEGDLSIFEAADRLYGAVASLATIGMGNVVLVYLTRVEPAQEGERAWRWVLVASGAWSLLWLGVGVLLWKYFVLGPILLPHQGETVAIVVNDTFLVLVLGMPGFIMTIVLSRRLLAVDRARDLVPISVVSLIGTGIGAWLLYGPYGTIGIAAAISATQYLIASLMFRALAVKAR